ncbi:MAG: hypothetical protein IJ471_07340 [Eubacterium sp.]|nr:hypothetical protein [Eubacterium sp.]
MAASCASGLALWYQNVVPTLLPFSILSYIIIHSNLYHALFSKICGILPSKAGFEAELLYPLFFGFLFGFPIGAKLMADLYETGHITGKGISFYTGVCNQFGPAFVINYIGFIQLQGLVPIPYLLLSIYGPSIALLILFPVMAQLKNGLFYRTGKNPLLQTLNRKVPEQQKKPASRSYLNFKIIDTGIINGFETMLRIAGYIVLFSILSGALNQLPGQHACFSSLVTGLLEVTTGVNKTISSGLSLEVMFCMICGTVSFGGFCGLFQTKAIMKNCPFHISSYIVLKLCCAMVSACIAYVCIWQL